MKQKVKKDSIDENSKSSCENIVRIKETVNLNLTKKRKLSTDEGLSGDDEIDETTKWNLEDKLNNNNTRYNSSFVKFLDAKDFNLTYFQKNGFQTPIVFTNKAGLGLRVPSENFKVSDVKSCVGSKRIVDVVDVSTQKGLTMTMKDWCQYYENPNRDKLLNVISLEFSKTKLENYVEAPQVVRHLDWIDNVWPQELIAAHTESTNLLDKMKYPKVQKYVLMSVGGCYTDFHIDMGGTSVWYHILKGSKVFWLIPPTDKNLKIYEKWTLSGEQNKVFLPDLVEECQRIELQQGWTFMLPSGWIHGVYTRHDSLVFGGNFLHSFNIPMQLKVYNIETKTKVPLQHRYPFFLEIMWFAMERYLHCLTGTTHLRDGLDGSYEDVEYDSVQYARQTFQPTTSVNHLTKYEFDGLKSLCSFFRSLNVIKWQVPKEIIQSELLLESMELLLKQNNVEESSRDLLCVTGQPITYWPKADKKFMKKLKTATTKRKSNKPVNSLDMTIDSISDTSWIKNESTDDNSPTKIFYKQTTGGKGKTGRKHNMRDIPRTKGSIRKRLRPQNIPRSAVERRRRVRCHRCEPCTRDDCGECKYCKDMKKFGGTGISKQCCLSKQCLAPLLPTTSVCMHCGEHIDRKNNNIDNSMFECEICFEIFHLDCFQKQYKHLKHIECIVNEDLANCWTCSNCISKGFHSKLEELKKETANKTITNNNSGNNSMNNTLNTNTDSNVSTKLNSEDEYSEIEDFDVKKTFNEHQNKVLTLSSLSNREKKIILEEFCEILVDDEPIEQKYSLNNKNPKIIKTEVPDEEIGISDLFKHEQNSNSQNSSDESPMCEDEEEEEEPTTICQILQVM